MSDTVDYEKLLASLLPFISPVDLLDVLDADGGDTIRAIISNTYDGDDEDAKFYAHKKAYDKQHGNGDDGDDDYNDGVKDGKDLKDLSPDDEFIKSIYKKLESGGENNDYYDGLVVGYEKARAGGKVKKDSAENAIGDTLNAFKTISDERCKEILDSYDSFDGDDDKIKSFLDSLNDEEYAALYKELAKRELTPEDVVATLSPEALDVLKEALNDDGATEKEPETEPEDTSDNKNALARLIGSIKL